MSRKGKGWIVRVGERPNFRYIGKDGGPTALTLGEAFIFTTFDEAFAESELYHNSFIERRWEDQ